MVKEKDHIYSCSKLFTCVAAMQLWEKGMFSLEDNLSDYMPASANAAAGAFASSFPGTIIPSEVADGNGIIVQKSGFFWRQNIKLVIK